MSYSKIVLLFFLCIVSINMYSQESLQLKKGFINTADGDVIKFSTLQQEGSVFKFTVPNSKLTQTFNQKDILSISKKSGDNMLLFGLGMGVSGGLGALLGANKAQRDLEAQGNVVDKRAKKNTILVITGISTLIGAIWGAGTPKYKKVYDNPDYANRFVDHLNLSVSVGNEIQFSLKYNF